MGSTNLPTSLTTFVGRESERRHLQELLRGARLVTLMGSGGIGKTRLAVEAAHEWLDDFVDGIWFVDLAPIGDSRLIPQLTAEALGLKEVLFQEQRDQLLGALAESVCLIVLDNCEHVISASASFADEVLRTCPSAKILATSREPLGVPGEVTFQVPSLSLSGDDSSALPEEHDSEALRLFVERARSADPRFGTDEQTVREIAEICRMLDGLPLAIELAAARVRSLDVGGILAGLEERFGLLTGGARTSLPRLQTLLASVEWSYELLAPEQQRLFRCLGIFAGHFSLSAAIAVCDTGDPASVRELFLSLVDRSLVQVDRRRVGAPYRLLETLREFALMNLRDTGEEEQLRARHLHHYSRLAVSLKGDLQGALLGDACEVLAGEHENLRAALDWGAEHDVERALEMTAALPIYWLARGHWSEAKRRATTALEATDAPPALRGAALAAVATIAATALDGPTAVTFADKALELGRAIKDQGIVATALFALGVIYGFLDPARARPLIAESLEAAGAADFDYVYVRGQTSLAIVETQTGEFKVARRLFNDASDSARAAGIDLALIPNRLWLAWTCVWQGDLEEAAAAAIEGIEICRRLGSPQFEGYLMSNLSVIAAYTGSYEWARALATQARLVAERLSDPAGLVSSVAALAFVELSEGNLVEGEKRVQELIPTARAIGPKWLHAFALVMLSELQRLAADLDAAVSTAREGGELGREASNRWLDASARLAEAKAVLALGEFEAAERLVHEALPTFRELGAKPDLASALTTLGVIASASSSWVEAGRLFGAASQLRDDIGLVLPVPIADEVKPWTTATDVELTAASVGQESPDPVEVDIEGVLEHVSRGWGRRSRPRTGWESLTPTELKVAALVAEGLTNPQIGERMFISRRTVQAHLSHVFGKLAMTSRSELAADATRRGLSS